MVFGLFGAKKPSLKLLPKQEVELRYENAGGETEYCQVRVREVGKKKVVMEPLGSQASLRLVPSQPVTVAALVENVLFSYDGSVLDARDREFDVSLPKEVEDLQVASDDDTRLEVSLPVQFRAMTTHHMQMAGAQAVTSKGMFLVTNVPIPPNTSLHLTVTLPASGSEIGLRARSLTSTRLEDSRKAVTEVEFEDIDEKDRSALLRAATYQHYRHRRPEKRAAK